MSALPRNRQNWTARPPQTVNRSHWDTPEFRLRNPQRPKELADLISQSIRLLHGGEVSSALHDSPAANVGIDPLIHGTRRPDDLFWELDCTPDVTAYLPSVARSRIVIPKFWQDR
jgi:hypothetical protein